MPRSGRNHAACAGRVELIVNEPKKNEKKQLSEVPQEKEIALDKDGFPDDSVISAEWCKDDGGCQ